MNIIKDFRVTQQEYKSKRQAIRAKYDNETQFAKSKLLLELQRLETKKNEELLALARQEENELENYRIAKRHEANGTLDDTPF